jgi:PAS domain S-box-containing protein
MGVRGTASDLDFLSGGGATGGLMRSHDWSDSALGHPSAWPQSLRSVVGLLLNSEFPMFVAWGPELGFLYNDRYAQILGAKHPAALGARFYDIWSEIWPDISPLIDSALAGEASYRENLPLVMNRRGYDEQTWFTFSYSPVRDESGAVAGMFCACNETTDKVLADQRLRESEARFREQFENANDFIFTADLEMRVTSCNPAVAAAVGRSPDELIGRSIGEFVPPDIWERTRAMLGAKLAGESSTKYEVEVFGRDGPRMTWEINSRLTRDAAGAPNGLHAIGRDVTRRRRSENELRESEERLRLALDAGRLGQVTFYLPEGRVMHGGALAVLFGYPPDKRMSLAEMRAAYHPDDLERVARERRANLSSGSDSFEIEHRVIWPDGQVRWLYGRGRMRRDEAGKPIVIDAVYLDDTDRHKAQEELRRFNETLEQRVAERTAELEQAHEQLRQSQKLEAMGQLTGGVAHDFNNLLTPIIGGLDLLKRQGLGGEREHRLIDGALQSAERARMLVQRLLAFARRQPLKAGAVDVAALVAGMAGLITSTSGPQIKLSLDFPPRLPPALADPNQLEMAILNLSVNARDAMPDGGTLTIAATSERVGRGHPSKLKPWEYVRLSVADTGLGMDETTLARSIEPFFSTKGIGKGTGLGLSMVHGLAVQLGGGFAIDSRPGLGTRVDLWLPRSETVADSEEAAPEKTPSASAKGRALLVDDEELVRMSTADMLTEMGYEVVETASASAALAQLGNGIEFNLLVTDHLMPGMTGADLARKVRDRWPGLPVLIVSGYAETDGLAPDLPRLSKPFRQADLAATIGAITRQSTPPL